MKTFNARSESIETKPSFSSSFKSRRCLIPVKGFLNGSMSGKKKFHGISIVKIMRYLHLPAFIRNGWTGRVARLSVPSPSLQQMLMNFWLKYIIRKKGCRQFSRRTRREDGSTFPLHRQKAAVMLKPCSPDILKAHTVGPLVNNRYANRNTPEVIRGVCRGSSNNQANLFHSWV